MRPALVSGFYNCCSVIKRRDPRILFRISHSMFTRGFHFNFKRDGRLLNKTVRRDNSARETSGERETKRA